MSVAINMFMSGPYLMEAFELKPAESKVILRINGWNVQHGKSIESVGGTRLVTPWSAGQWACASVFGKD